MATARNQTVLRRVVTGRQIMLVENNALTYKSINIVGSKADKVLEYPFVLPIGLYYRPVRVLLP